MDERPPGVTISAWPISISVRLSFASCRFPLRLRQKPEAKTTRAPPSRQRPRFSPCDLSAHSMKRNSGGMVEPITTRQPIVTTLYFLSQPMHLML